MMIEEQWISINNGNVAPEYFIIVSQIMILGSLFTTDTWQNEVVVGDYYLGLMVQYHISYLERKKSLKTKEEQAFK